MDEHGERHGETEAVREYTRIAVRRRKLTTLVYRGFFAELAFVPVHELSPQLFIGAIPCTLIKTIKEIKRSTEGQHSEELRRTWYRHHAGPARPCAAFRFRSSSPALWFATHLSAA